MATYDATPVRVRGERRVFTAGANPLPIYHVDVLLLMATGAVSALGLLMVFAATKSRLAENHTATHYYLQRQGIALAIGMTLCLFVTLIDYRRLLAMWPLLYGATLPLLLAVRFVGSGRGGTTAWFNLGPLQFQPSEMAKLTLIVALAGYCQQHRGDLDAWRLTVALFLAAVPMTLVMLQGDLGTVLVMVVCVVAILVVAGLRPLHMLVLFMVSVSLVAGLAVSGKFSGYRALRFTSFLDQQTHVDLKTADQAAYNLAQSKLAIAHGGLSGQGLYKGTLTNLSSVPAQHTDFIFTAVGEELGFRGAAILLALFALIVWRTWRTALTAGDLFGSLIAVGLVAMFTFQVFENVGMTMGIMPITGIPLPFMSYGGSAMIAYWVAIGMAVNIHMRRFS